MQVAEQVPCVLLNGISWDGYLQIDEVLGEGGGARLRFANDQLEITSPTSRNHEYIKTNIGRMIEAALTSGGIDKLDFYKPFQIPEVWIWEDDELNVFVFENGEYVYNPEKACC